MANAPGHCLQADDDGKEDVLRAAVSGALQTPVCGPNGTVQHTVVGEAPAYMLATVDWRAQPDTVDILTALGKLREVRPCRFRGFFVTEARGGQAQPWVVAAWLRCECCMRSWGRNLAESCTNSAYISLASFASQASRSTARSLLDMVLQNSHHAQLWCRANCRAALCSVGLGLASS